MKEALDPHIVSREWTNDRASDEPKDNAPPFRIFRTSPWLNSISRDAALDQTEEHGPLGEPMAHAVQACVHCGFCLAACPTYHELGQEMDTPRGRIVLMKQVLEGELPWEAAQTHVDRCLGCLACEPACPSGVPYRDLLSPFRAKMETETNSSARG